MGFDVLGTFRGAAGQMLAGVGDICLRVVDGVVQVFTATRAGGGVLALELQAGGDGLALIDQQAIAAGQVLSAPGRLSFLTVAGETALVWTGGWARAPGGWALAGDGRLGAAMALAGGPTGVIAAQAFATVGGTGLAILAPAGDGVLQVWAIGAGGRMALRDSLAFGAAGQGFDVAALETLRLGSATFVLSLSGGEDALAVHRLRPDGGLTTVSTVGASAGLGLAAPSALEVVETGGRIWVLVAGAGSSSISVLALDAGGGLTLTDHVIDTLDTRFQSVAALATAVVGDRVFVFAAGGDQGLQAFVLLPDGRLVSAGQQLAQAGLPLDDITALEAVARGGRIELVLGTENGGVLRLRFDPGDLAPERRGGPGGTVLTGDARGDLLAGMAGDDTLLGGGGADILCDGSGTDDLAGGTGADIFVLTGDGDTDVIRDFELGRDRLDLSGWGRIYAVEALPMAERRGVVVIRWGDEVLYLHTADGRNIDPDVFGSADFFGLWHLLAPTVQPGGMIGGSADRDTLTGGAGDDTLLGSAGADRLAGGGGFDMVDYGAAVAPVLADLSRPGGNRGLAQGDSFRGIEGVAGGSGADRLTGDGAANRLIGRGGADVLLGGGGGDLLDGGAGPDLLAGGAGADTLRGGAGIDRAGYAGAGQAVTLSLAVPGAGRGGAAGDVLSGIENLTGSRFADWLGGDGGGNALEGRGGNDWLEGGDGNDRLTGGAGHDTLQGGKGEDTLTGGAGSDWVSYEGRLGVRVDLALRGPQNTGGRGIDWLTGIEHVISGWRNDWLFGSGAANRLRAGEGHDRLDGRGGADWLDAGAGNDLLQGGVGNDRLMGGAGADRLRGGEGADVLLGGRGADRFIFDTGRDRVLDHHGAEGDRILIDSAVLRGTAGMTGAEVVARWGVDLGAHVALDFGSKGFLLVEDLANLAALARATEVI